VNKNFIDQSFFRPKWFATFSGSVWIPGTQVGKLRL
jgi:hypothetical protein